MNEILDWLQKAAPLIGSFAVPAVGLVAKIRQDRQDPAAIRSMKQHAKLYESLPENSRSHIEALIQFETELYAAEMKRKAARTLNGGAVAAFVLIALVTGAAVYWAILWGTIWWPAYVVASLVGIFGVLLLLVGAPQLFDDPDEAKPTRAANSQAGQKLAKSR